MSDQLPMEDRLSAGMEALGFAPDGGPVDVDIADKAIFALTGAMAEREDLREQLATVTADRDQLQAATAADHGVLALLSGTVGDLVDALPAATLPELLLLIEAEGGSKKRKTAIAAMIEALTREEGWQLAAGVTVRILDQVDHDKLISERDQLASALDGAGADIAAAQAMLPRKARAIGPIEGAADGAALADLIGGTVQIVLSDGEQEIVAVDPFTFSGSGAWVRRGSGFMLRSHLTVKGPVFGAAAYPVAGFGLIGADGEQVGWCALPNLVPVGGGQEVQFRDSVLFG